MLKLGNYSLGEIVDYGVTGEKQFYYPGQDGCPPLSTNPETLESAFKTYGDPSLQGYTLVEVLYNQSIANTGPLHANAFFNHKSNFVLTQVLIV